jgi:hypothetical protein
MMRDLLGCLSLRSGLCLVLAALSPAIAIRAKNWYSVANAY